MECTTVYRQSTTFLGEFVIFLQASRWVRMLALPRLGVLGLLPTRAEGGVLTLEVRTLTA